MKAPLTTREVEVMKMVASGRSYKAIAIELEVTVRTVQFHVVNAAEKIGGNGLPKARLMLFFVDLIRDNRG